METFTRRNPVDDVIETLKRIGSNHNQVLAADEPPDTDPPVQSMPEAA